MLLSNQVSKYAIADQRREQTGSKITVSEIKRLYQPLPIHSSHRGFELSVFYFRGCRRKFLANKVSIRLPVSAIVTHFNELFIDFLEIDAFRNKGAKLFAVDAIFDTFCGRTISLYL